MYSLGVSFVRRRTLLISLSEPVISRLSEPVSSAARWVGLRLTLTSTQGEAAGEAALTGIDLE
jgi:hypothetical protein